MDLQKGQKIKLSDLTPARQINLCVCAPMKAGESDISCFGVDANGKLSDDRYFVFYNQPATPENAITMQGNTQSTTFSIDLNKLPASIKKLVLTVATDGSTAMCNVVQGSVAVQTSGQTVASYSFTGANFTQEKALILCELYEKEGVWRFSVVASGFNGGLDALLAHFGGEQQKPANSPPPAIPPAAPPQPTFEPVQKVAPQIAPTPAPTPQAPPPATPVGAVNLKKSGDTHKINLSKDNNPRIHVNLNWNTFKKSGLFGPKPIDLDLACMFRLKTGQKGIIQALGKAFGSGEQLPFIYLDQDDRTGSNTNGENMFFTKPEMIEFAVVFAFIYEGVPNWKTTDASVVLKQQGAQDIEIHIDNANNRDRFCVLATLRSVGSQLEVRREELFFPGHREVDKQYGFGFNWQAGRK